MELRLVQQWGSNVGNWEPREREGGKEIERGRERRKTEEV